MKIEKNRMAEFRKSKSSLESPHVQFFYSILLMVENDEPKRITGYNWQSLKKTIKQQITIFNDTENKKITIPTKIDSDTIYFKESSSVAYNFIRCVRHAFAHNYITYNSTEDELIIKLPKKGKGELKLYCKLKYDSLKRIITILKKQKSK